MLHHFGQLNPVTHYRKRRLKLPLVTTVSVIHPVYGSSDCWSLSYRQIQVMQQTTAETDFGGVVYSSPTDGADDVSTDHDSGSQQLMTPHRVRQLRQELAKTSVSGAAARDAFQRRSESLAKRLDAKKTMAEISIPGMRAVFGRNAHITRRIIWILILVTCFSIAVVQVQDRVMYYLSTPVTVNVRVSRNDSIRFPILSICNKNLFNMTAIAILKDEKAQTVAVQNGTVVTQNEIDRWKLADLIGVRGLNDAVQLWDFIAHSMEKMTLECFMGRNIRCEQRGQWKKIYNYMGVCYSYVLDHPYVEATGLFNNLYLKMNDTEPEAYEGDNSGWKILIHDPKDSPLIELRTHGTTLYRGWAKDIRIYMRQFKTLDTSYRPCSANASYSFSNCVAECFIAAAVKSNICRLPYIDESYQLKACTTQEDYKKATKMMDDLLFFGAWSANNCSCPRQCYQDLYIPYTETTQMERKNANLGKLRIYYQDMTFDDIEEEIGYAAIPLLCDIGGSLGLLLGASVLTFFEIIEAVSAALVHLTHCCCRVVTVKRDPQRTQDKM